VFTVNASFKFRLAQAGGGGGGAEGIATGTKAQPRNRKQTNDGGDRSVFVTTTGRGIASSSPASSPAGGQATTTTEGSVPMTKSPFKIVSTSNDEQSRCV
jgi:hypothetical protein